MIRVLWVIICICDLAVWFLLVVFFYGGIYKRIQREVLNDLHEYVCSVMGFATLWQMIKCSLSLSLSLSLTRARVRAHTCMHTTHPLTRNCYATVTQSLELHQLRGDCKKKCKGEKYAFFKTLSTIILQES